MAVYKKQTIWLFQNLEETDYTQNSNYNIWTAISDFGLDVTIIGMEHENRTDVIHNTERAYGFKNKNLGL